MVGFIPATIMIMIFGFVNTYTVHLQTIVKVSFSSSKVKNFTDLGEACFGRAGKIIFAITIIMN